ncbi:TPA: hypothetical protein I7726_08260 [Vibrio vulnificus]|nr:hypothetical protein [Vibrio vulnificus]
MDRFLHLLEKDIEQHLGNLITPSQEIKEELDKNVDDYSVDLDGGYWELGWYESKNRHSIRRSGS